VSDGVKLAIHNADGGGYALAGSHPGEGACALIKVLITTMAGFFTCCSFSRVFFSMRLLWEPCVIITAESHFWNFRQNRHQYRRNRGLHNQRTFHHSNGWYSRLNLSTWFIEWSGRKL